MNSQRQSVILDGRRFNYSITPEQVVSAISKVERYSFAEKIRRFDDVFAAQPAVLGAAVQKAFDNIVAMLKFYDGETVAEAKRLQVIWTMQQKEHSVIAFVISYLVSMLKALTRDQELVRNCCLAMTNAYLAEYEAMQ